MVRAKLHCISCNQHSAIPVSEEFQFIKREVDGDKTMTWTRVKYVCVACNHEQYWCMDFSVEDSFKLSSD